MALPGAYSRLDNDDDDNGDDHMGFRTRRSSGSNHVASFSSRSTSPPSRASLARFSAHGDGLPLPATAPNVTASTYPPAARTAARLLSSAKGKGRADTTTTGDDEAAIANAEEGTAGPTGMAFSIRFTDGSEDLVDLWVGEKESVAEVKRRIRFLRPSLMHQDRPRRLRLIQLGRLLTDGTYLVPWTVQLLSRRAKLVRQQTQPNTEALLEGAIEGIEAAVGVSVGRGSIDKGKRDEARRKDPKGKGKERDTTLAGTEAEDNKRVWLHCSVGEPMDDEEIDSERVQTTQITPLQGFDRLRDAGFSEEEISLMRAEFRRNTVGSTPIGGDDDEHARALEDQWMEGLTGQNDAAVTESTSEGYWIKMLGGLCVGFFFPFLPFFFFRTQLFSKTTQMAIVLGVVINVGFGLLRVFT